MNTLTFNLVKRFLIPGLMLCLLWPGTMSSQTAKNKRPDIKGVVKGDKGAPLAGATVFVYTALPKEGPGVLCPYCYDDCRKRVTVAADGSFMIADVDPTLKFNLMVTAKGYRPKLVSKVDPTEKPVDVELKEHFTGTDPMQSVHGRVLDTEGKPVMGAVASIKSITRGDVTRYGSDKDVDPMAVTDEEGRFTLNSVLPFDKVALEVEARNLAKGVFNSLKSGETVHDLKMNEGVTIMGRVVKNGQPMAGVEVGVSGEERWSEVYIGNYSTATGKDGKFVFVNIPSKRAYQFYGLMKSLGEQGALASRIIQAGPEGGTLDLGDVEVKPAYVVSGQVKLADGKPLPSKVRMTLGRDQAWDSQMGEADEQGRFGVPAESISVSARMDGHRLTPRNASIDPANPYHLIGRIATNKLDLVIEMEAGTRSLERLDGNQSLVRNEPLRGVEAAGPQTGDFQVSGTVTDEETRQPVREFTVTMGRRDQFGTNFEWIPSRKTTHTNGSFSIWLTRQTQPSAVLIEAKGYHPVASGALPNQETNLVFTVKKGGDYAGIVKLPDGRPAKDVHVYLTDSGRNGVYLTEGGHVRSDMYRGTKSIRTDEEGKFSFPVKIDAYSFCVHEPSGFAEVRIADFLKNPVIQMQALARIEGKLMIGGRPGGKEAVRLSLSHVPYYYHPRSFSSVSLFMNTTTKVDGTFVFEHVPPLPVEVYHSPKVKDQSLGTIPVSQNIAFNLQAGETKSITLGGQGRPVTGKFLVAGYDEKIDWRQEVQTLELVVAEPPNIPSLTSISSAYATLTRSLKSKEELQKAREDYEKRREASVENMKKFYATKEGLAHHFSKRKYALNIQQDGSFRIEDVPAGKYTLKVELREGGADPFARLRSSLIASLNKEIEVPAIPGGRSDEPLDLGTIEMAARGVVRSGKVAPDFSAKTLDGKNIKLSDFKGKYVLLDFWAVWCGPCVAETPHLKEAYALIKDNPNFAMIGLSLDPEESAPIEYAKKNQLGWIQGFLGDWSKTQVPSQYGVEGIPSIMLIGPDGKIVANGLRGTAIKAAVQKAMGQK